MNKFYMNGKLIHKASDHNTKRCEVEKWVFLPHSDFERLKSNPYQEHEAITAARDLMYEDKNAYHCIMLLDEYDRTMWVLAATVKNKSFDGRFSNVNKGWARTIIPSHLDKYEFDEYAVQSHPAVLNGFIDSVRAEYEALELLSSEECLKDSYKEDYTNKLLILRPEILKDEARKPALQYFYAEDGFGCDPSKLGRKVFGSFLADGERTHFDRGDFIGVADTEKLPEWASKRLEAISAPKMKVRISPKRI